MAAAGATVIVAARSTDRLENLVEELRGLGQAAHPLTLDVSQAESLREQLADLPTELLPVQILVNNAGVTADNLLARMSLEQWSHVIDTNLTGTFALSRALYAGCCARGGAASSTSLRWWR